MIGCKDNPSQSFLKTYHMKLEIELFGMPRGPGRVKGQGQGHIHGLGQWSPVTENIASQTFSPCMFSHKHYFAERFFSPS